MGIANFSNGKEDCDNACECNDAGYLRQEQENLTIVAFAVSLLGSFLYFFIGSVMHESTFIQKFIFWSVECVIVAVFFYIAYKYFTNYQILKNR